LLSKFIVIFADQSRHKDLKVTFFHSGQRTQSLLPIYYKAWLLDCAVYYDLNDIIAQIPGRNSI